MTNFNRSSLKTFFETGDVPTGTDYANLIDSCVNMVESGVQTMGGALNPTELITSRVSAGIGKFTGTMTIAGITSVGTIYADNLIATSANITFNNISAAGIVSAATLNSTGASTISGKLTGATASFSGIVSADAGITITGDVSAATGTVYASAMRSTNGLISGVGVVSAAGTTQGTAAILTNVVNRGKGIADGTTTGFAPLANRAGLVQYLFNEGVSANLWPPTGGTINGLAANAVFPLAASAMVTIVHLTASAMAVK